MFDDLYPRERDIAIEQGARRQQYDKEDCAKLSAEARGRVEKCILIDHPTDGWKIVEDMRRREAFLEALPVIVAAVFLLVAVSYVRVKYGAGLLHAARKHFNDPVRLMQWLLALVALLTATAVVRLFHLFGL